jgi:hypothetical protein
MLKKSLVAIAVLAFVMPAFAGDQPIKIHKNWPTQYVWQDFAKFDVVVDVGYYINFKSTDSIKVQQTVLGTENPYYTYYGCRTVKVQSNFNATIKGSVAAKSAAGGNWSATFNGQSQLDIPSTGGGDVQVEICVLGKNVQIGKLDGQGGQDNVKVAELTVSVLATDLIS